MAVRQYIGARYVPIFDGTWDNTKAYEPLTVVEYQGNSYTSRQAVPTGIAITNEQYWVETGNYNAQIEAYRQEVDEIQELTIENQIAIANKKIKSASEHTIVYVASNTGSDDNDGLSADSPVKTLMKAWDVLALYTINNYIRIIESGTYDLSYPTVAGGQTHLIVEAPNVSINWGLNQNVIKAFYGGYFHFDGYNTDVESEMTVLNCYGWKDAYLEGCKASFSRIVFNSQSSFGFVGAAATVDNCIFHCRVNCSEANVIFSNCSFNFTNIPIDENNNPATFNYGFHAYNQSKVRFTGSMNISYNNTFIPADGSVICVDGFSEFNLNGTYPVNGNYECSSYRLSDCKIWATDARIDYLYNITDSILERCTLNGNFINSKDNPITISENMEVGTQYAGHRSVNAFIFDIYDNTDARHHLVTIPNSRIATTDFRILIPTISNGNKTVTLTVFANSNVRYTSSDQGMSLKISCYAV